MFPWTLEGTSTGTGSAVFVPRYRYHVHVKVDSSGALTWKPVQWPFTEFTLPALLISWISSTHLTRTKTGNGKDSRSTHTKPPLPPPLNNSRQREKQTITKYSPPKKNQQHTFKCDFPTEQESLETRTVTTPPPQKKKKKKGTELIIFYLDSCGQGIYERSLFLEGWGRGYSLQGQTASPPAHVCNLQLGDRSCLGPIR